MSTAILVFGCFSGILSTVVCVLLTAGKVSARGKVIYTLCLLGALLVAWNGSAMGQVYEARGMSSVLLALYIPIFGRFIIRRLDRQT